MENERPKPGLDLSKLLASAKKPEPAAAQEAAAPVERAVTLPGKLTFSEPPKGPAKPIGVGGQRAAGQVGQAGGVAKTAKPGQMGGAFAAPARAAPEQALNAAAPSNRKLEKQMSRQGAAIDRLNVVQKEARRYPHLHFGIDEIFLAIQDLVNVIRANLWQALPEYPHFVAGVKITGAVRRDAYVSWDGSAFSGVLSEAPAEPDLYAVIDSDDIVDNIRGKLGCLLFQTGLPKQIHGDAHLARLLRLLFVPADPEQLEDVREREEARALEMQRQRRAAKDPLAWMQKTIELKMEKVVSFIAEPIFFRVTVEGAPQREILFHIEKGKLATLVGKPGETLIAGALELAVSPLALQALWDMECDWHFLLTAGLVRASGDLDLISRLRLANFEIVRRVRILNASQKVLSEENPYWLDLRTEPKK